MRDLPPSKSFFYPRNWVSLVFIVIGLLLGFFFIDVGGGLVGLGAGIGLYEKTHATLLQLIDSFPREGSLPTLIIIGIALYFLLSIPVFIIAFALGFAIITLIKKLATNLL